MSYDEIDARDDAMMDAIYEQFMQDPSVQEQFYQELYDDVVKDYTESRFRSFYESKPNVAAPAIVALKDAKELFASHATAAFIFATIAMETGVKSLLLKPIVHGLVHSDAAAALITELAIPHREQGFTTLLLDLLRDYGKVDPRSHKRAGNAKTCLTRCHQFAGNAISSFIKRNVPQRRRRSRRSTWQPASSKNYSHAS